MANENLPGMNILSVGLYVPLSSDTNVSVEEKNGPALFEDGNIFILRSCFLTWLVSRLQNFEHIYALNSSMMIYYYK